MREFEVSQLNAVGLNKEEIANRLHISVLTVQTHFQNIYRKLEIKNNRELVIWFIRATETQNV